ncbi:hypothetical protein REPUB_Repub06bG0171000 [Reevesia pubescens]
MPSQFYELQFVLIPLMCPGHLIPMVNMGRLLAQHGVTVTIVTTPLNAVRFKSIIDRDIASGIQIRLLQLRFPCVEVGLPEGCENIDALPSRLLSKNFMDGVGRLAFDGTSCFTVTYSHFIGASKIHEKVSDDLESFVVPSFVVPGLPDRIELTKAQLPIDFNPGSVVLKDKEERMKVADMTSYGLVVNSFEELESGYVEEYRKAKGDKIWCIGPVSLCNKGKLDMAQRGNKASVDVIQCLQWLDSWPQNTVVYACLGTLSCVAPMQLIELALGLEASNRPFIWVIREGYKSDEFKKWLSEEEFEERTKGRGVLIKGWAPQLSILSHPAIGGLLTHCGWNSVLEGVCAGLPMITWPLLADQFFNEKLVVQVLKIGERVGAEISMKWGEEEKYGVMVKREQIMKAIDLVMDAGEGEERRKRVMELGVLAKKAFEKKGSSYVNVKRLIEDIIQISGRKAEA